MIVKHLTKVAALLIAGLAAVSASAASKIVTRIDLLNSTTVEVRFDDGNYLFLDFYGENIFRVFQDDAGGIIRYPEANPPAKILVDNARRPVGKLTVSDGSSEAVVTTRDLRIGISKADGCLHVTDQRTGKMVFEQTAPVEFQKGRYTLRCKEQPQEYFYGGGVQNGRFSHKGKKIEIVNSNSWTDGGVASPAPYYWSTAGYAVMCHTFAPGAYDFGAAKAGEVSISHHSTYLDIFLMVDSKPADLLQDYYQLTGNPVLLPKFAFYEGHLNAYNRDYWKETADSLRGVRFEDSKLYSESQKDNGGIKESLNGEKDNYQFSARAVVDRYKAYDMPLGWVLPNDGYGAGYGQTETLDGNIANLKSFGDYARENGVEIGLWTQSNLHPKAGVSALLQRDIVKEVRDAGVRVLKTDVAWVGSGYSFGLNGISDVAHIMPYYGRNSRPFIISLDGWAGTQRYAGVWTGDQTGGEWEYIRFHIPTYIGSGLSGMSNITSDMDGIFGGGNAIVNIRDFQWKTFTPMQLNMDGWGYNAKYPHIFGEPATSINRNYLKLKSELLPYSYSCAHEAVTGLPMIRAMFLDYPNEYTLGTRTQYQFMYGPWFLVAPVYQETAADKEGNDIRDGIYLPEGQWIDFFTGDVYEGGRLLNNYSTPIWKLPLFVKNGAIVPVTNANNNVHQIDRSVRTYWLWPHGESRFTQYDDDGTTESYLHGQYATTLLSSKLSGKGVLTFEIEPAEGSFDGMERMQKTQVIINATARPKDVKATVDGKKVQVDWTYVEAPELNRFSTNGTEAASFSVTKNPEIHVSIPATDITAHKVVVTVKGYQYEQPVEASATYASHSGTLQAPSQPEVKATATTLTPQWSNADNADYYEIAFDGQTYSTIRRGQLTFDNLKPSTEYDFSLRAVNKDGASEWTKFSATTAEDPLKYALHGASGKLVNAKDQEGLEVYHLFDFVETGDMWHTEYQEKAVPFDLIVDLHQTATLEKMQYLPRPQGRNGMLQEVEVFTSADKKNWQPAGKASWKADAKAKTFEFADNPSVRYVKLSVSKAVGDFGSGMELYFFQVPGTKTYLAGDVNQDKKIDENDLTSYMNYCGLREGDPDFEGYISKGDLNGNGLIDAYDISEVATRLEGGAAPNRDELAGNVAVTTDKLQYNAGDDIAVTVKGTGLRAVNALNLVMPYNEQDMKFERIEPEAVKDMRNMTNDRLHSNGQKVLYPCFVNVGDKPDLNGDQTLFTIHFKAMRTLRLKPWNATGMLVDKSLNQLDLTLLDGQ